MIRLCELRKHTRRPLTRLLHEAVSAYYHLLTTVPVPEHGEGPSRCCAAARLEWRGTLENAAIQCVSCGFVLADDGHLADWHNPEETAWQVEQQVPDGTDAGRSPPGSAAAS